MEYVKSFRDLEVYKFARQGSKEIFEVTKKFPKEEMYSLTEIGKAELFCNKTTTQL